MNQIPYWDERQEDSVVPLHSHDGDEQDHDQQLDNSNLTTQESIGQIANAIEGIKADLANLNDLFVRRLLEDKQKNELIRTLDSVASFAFIEPFLHDLILLLDRTERVDDNFAASVTEELLDILMRRNVQKIHVGTHFDPNTQKVVKVVETSEVDGQQIAGIVRNGYLFGEKVLRPAEIVLAKPAKENVASNNEKECKHD